MGAETEKLDSRLSDVVQKIFGKHCNEGTIQSQLKNLDLWLANEGTVRTLMSLLSIHCIITHSCHSEHRYDYALTDLPYGGVYNGRSEPEDVLLHDWGPCPASVRKFKGRVFWFDGENYLRRRTQNFGPKGVYFGMPLDNQAFVRWSFLATAAIGNGFVDKIVNSIRPDKIGNEFLIYTQSNCVPHRERAFDAIAQIQTPTAGGRCHGSITEYKKITIPHSDWGT